jgi:tight adherence protein C
MMSGWVLSAAAVALPVFLAASLTLLRLLRRQDRLAARVQLSRGIAPVKDATSRDDTIGHNWKSAIRRLGEFILRKGFLSSRTRAELELTLMSAGLRGRNGLEFFVGVKILLLVSCPVLAVLALQGTSIPLSLTWIMVAIACVLGLLAPDFVLRHQRKRYVQRVEQGVPDALDLLVVCAQAGLGLTAAIVRVAEELQQGKADIGLELAITASEMQIMTDSRAALLQLGSRTGVQGLVRLSKTLAQSIQYGTPLSQSMRSLSAEMRQETLTRFEARAARLGVLLTVPMIVFILPCLFLVVGGPAAVQVMGLGSP